MTPLRPEISYVSLIRTARVPYGALLLVGACLLLPPQMRDMLAALRDSGRWGAIAAFPGAIAVLGFLCWFWARAAISARFDLPDSDVAWRAVLREGAAGKRPNIHPAALALVPQAPIPIAGLIGFGIAGASRAPGLGAATLSLLLVLWILVDRRRAIHATLHRLFWPHRPFDRRPLAPETSRLQATEHLGQALRRAPFRAATLLRRAPSGTWPAAALLVVSLAVFVITAAASFFPASQLADPRNLIWTAFSGPTPALLGVALMVGPMTVIAFIADGWRPVLRIRGAPIGLARPPVVLALTAASTLTPLLISLHAVRVIPGPLPVRPTLIQAYQNWQSACGPGARPIIVSISGGAARSGLWGAAVMARVDAVIGQSPGVGADAGHLPAAIFAISSVSGGSLGAAGYLAARATDTPCHLSPPNADRFASYARQFMAADAIGPLLAGFVLSDMPRALIGAVPAAFGANLRGGDRAAAIERAFESNAQKAATHSGLIAVPLDGAYLSLAEKPGMPLWIANGADGDTGRRALATPVRPQPDSAAWPFRGTIDLLGVAGADMPISTIANATARFPFLEPSAEIGPNQAPAAMSVIDGGYYDDSGVETALELTAWLRQQGANPILVVATGSGYGQGLGQGMAMEAMAARDDVLRCGPETMAPDHPAPARLIAKFLAPLVGVYEARAAHVDALLRRARYEYCDPGNISFFHFYLGALGDEPVPLNWVLSRRMADHVWRSAGQDMTAEAAKDRNIRGNLCEAGRLAAVLGGHGAGACDGDYR